MERTQTEGVLKEPQVWYHGDPSAAAEGYIMTRTVVRVSPRFLWFYATQYDPHQHKYVETSNIRRATREGWFPLKGEAFHDLIAKLTSDIEYREKTLAEAKRKRDEIAAIKDQFYKDTTPVFTREEPTQ